jgi:hypothetical protein
MTAGRWTRYRNQPEALEMSADVSLIGGQRLRRTGDLDGALALCGRARDVANRALRLRPKDPYALRCIEISLSEAGSILRLKGDLSNALGNQLEAHRNALQVLGLKPVAKSRRQAALKKLALSETLRQLHRGRKRKDKHARRSGSRRFLPRMTRPTSRPVGISHWLGCLSETFDSIWGRRRNP